MVRIRSALVALVATAACSGGPSLQDGRSPTGSQSLVTSSGFDALYVANAAEDTIARIDTADHVVTELPLAGEPTRIARAGGRVIVSLRAKRRLALFDETDSGLVPAGEIEVGAEPYGIVAREDGRFFYVASSTSDLVEEFDAATLVKTRAWTVSGEPRWLAIHPSGRTLYAASVLGSRVSFIDLDTGRSSEVDLPIESGFSNEGEQVELTSRVTGDPAVSPDGSKVAIPTVYVDNQTAISDDEGDGEEDPKGGYSERINPVVVMLPVNGDGHPDGEAALAPIKAFAVSSYPASVAFSPDSKLVVATMEGASGVAVLASKIDQPSSVEPRVGLFNFVPSDVITTEAGPRGIAFTADDTAWVYGFLDSDGLGARPLGQPPAAPDEQQRWLRRRTRSLHSEIRAASRSSRWRGATCPPRSSAAGACSTPPTTRACRSKARA